MRAGRPPLRGRDFRGSVGLVLLCWGPFAMSVTSPIQPLAGLRVLDLSRVLAGPMCAMSLADLGADVIKVEHPSRGDDTRDWGVRVGSRNTSYFNSANRNKRSISLDLQSPEGQQIALQLAAQSDVVVAELQGRRRRKARPGLRTAQRPESAPGVLLDLGLRTLGPRGHAARLRPRGAGRIGPDGDERRRRPGPAQVWRRRRRHVHRHVFRPGHPRGTVRAPPHGPGPPCADGAVRLRADDHQLLRHGSAAQGRRPAQVRQRPPVHRALRRVRGGRRPARDHRGQQRPVPALLPAMSSATPNGPPTSALPPTPRARRTATS